MSLRLDNFIVTPTPICANLTIGYIYIGSGTLAISGTAAPVANYSYATTGGLILGGDATELINYPYITTGGLVLGGDAIEETPTFIYGVTNGGLVLDGSAISAQQAYSHVSTGGLIVGGTAGLQIHYTFMPTGGVVVEGEAGTKLAHIYVATGSLTISGEVVVLVSYIYVSSDGLVITGVANLVATYSVTATGGLTVGGTGALSQSRNYTASGSLTIGGEVDASQGIVYMGSGVITLNSTATGILNFLVIATGGLVLDGTTNEVVGSIVTALGGLVIAGGVTESPSSFGLQYETPSVFGFGLNSIFDTFNRPNNTDTDPLAIDNFYTENSGDWRIENNRLALYDLSGFSCMSLTNDLTRADYSIEIKVKSRIQAAGVVVRYQDDNNFYGLYINYEDNELQLVRREAGLFTLLDSSGIAATKGNEYTIKLDVFGSTLMGHFGGTILTSAVDTTFAGPGKAGMSYIPDAALP